MKKRKIGMLYGDAYAILDEWVSIAPIEDRLREIHSRWFGYVLMQVNRRPDIALVHRVEQLRS